MSRAGRMTMAATTAWESERSDQRSEALQYRRLWSTAYSSQEGDEAAYGRPHAELLVYARKPWFSNRRLLPRRGYRNGAMSATRRSCTAGYNGVPLECSVAVRGLFQR